MSAGREGQTEKSRPTGKRQRVASMDGHGGHGGWSGGG